MPLSTPPETGLRIGFGAGGGGGSESSFTTGPAAAEFARAPDSSSVLELFNCSALRAAPGNAKLFFLFALFAAGDLGTTAVVEGSSFAPLTLAGVAEFDGPFAAFAEGEEDGAGWAIFIMFSSS